MAITNLILQASIALANALSGLFLPSVQPAITRVIFGFRCTESSASRESDGQDRSVAFRRAGISGGIVLASGRGRLSLESRRPLRLQALGRRQAALHRARVSI